jgi:hypothetical protein
VSHEYRSSFDRAPFFADLRYQLGWGGVDDFRQQEGVTATGAADLRTRNAAFGVELPLGLRVRGVYQDLENINWIRRGEAQGELRQTSREWPSGAVSWLYTPRWGLNRAISTLSSQTRYRKTITTTVQPTVNSNLARTENRSRTFNPSLTLTWVGGLLTGAQYSRTTTDVVTAGNVTRSDREDWGANASVSFRSPTRLLRLRNPLRSSLAITFSDVLVCLTRAATADCVPVSDSRRTQADMRLDTGFSPSVTGGASFGYVLTEQRHTATKLSQAIFTVFAEINFSAGQVR